MGPRWMTSLGNRFGRGDQRGAAASRWNRGRAGGGSAAGRRVGAAGMLAGMLVAASTVPTAAAAGDVGGVVRDAQARVVKIYGAGGIAGLEGYQSGFLISPAGHIATAWSYVLDAEPLVVLDDGRRYTAEVVGFEPHLEMAVLKIPEDGLPYFSLDETERPAVGTPVVALSNLFGIAAGSEPASAMYGHVAARTPLSARRGAFRTAYQGDVVILDLIANNPGAAGGAVVDLEGRLVGMLGKEMRDARSGAWLNYALPADVLRPALRDIVQGRQPSRGPEATERLPPEQAQSLARLGLVLVPDVMDRTPAFVDAVAPESVAREAGLRPDDLIVLVDDVRVDSQATLREVLDRTDRRDPLTVTVQRADQLETVTLRP